MRRVLRLAVVAVLGSACGSDSSGPPPPPPAQPAFTITSPGRAAMLQEGGLEPADVAISGQVCDPRDPITSLTVNGVAVPISGAPLCAPFNVTRQSRWGLNILTAEAQNSRGGRSRVTRAFLRGPTYFPAAVDPDPTALVPRGLFAQLNQEAIDDGHRLSVDDFGTLAALSVNDADPGATMPSPLAVHPDDNGDGQVDTQTYNCTPVDRTNVRTGYRVTHGAVTRGVATASVETILGPGLRVSAQLSNISMPVAVTEYLDFGCLGGVQSDATGMVGMQTVVYTWLLGGHISAGTLEFVRTGRNVVFGTAVFNVDLTGFTFPDDIIAATNNQLRAGLDDLLDVVIGPALDALFTNVLPLQPVTVPGAGIAVATQPDTFATLGASQQLRTGAAAQARPASVRAGGPPARGPLRRDGAPPVLDAPLTFDLATALKDDFVNQALWSAWRSGVLDVASLAGAGCDAVRPGASLAAFAELPPVLMPGTADTVLVGLGDTRLSGTLDGRAVVLYGSAVLKGVLGVSANALTMTFTEAPLEIGVDVASIDDSTARAPVSEAASPVFACLARAVTQLALAGLPLPGFDLTGASGVPPGTTLRTGNVSVRRDGSYTTLRGNVQRAP